MGTATHRVVGSLAASANLSYVPQEHEPVLAEELIDLLEPRPGETFVDCTFGGGGHTRALLAAAEAVTVVALDRDPAARDRAVPLQNEFGKRFESTPVTV
jgi:16S rRNA C1402 N4-methylase RsmH